MGLRLEQTRKLCFNKGLRIPFKANDIKNTIKCLITNNLRTNSLTFVQVVPGTLGTTW